MLTVGFVDVKKPFSKFSNAISHFFSGWMRVHMVYLYFIALSMCVMVDLTSSFLLFDSHTQSTSDDDKSETMKCVNVFHFMIFCILC